MGAHNGMLHFQSEYSHWIGEESTLTGTSSPGEGQRVRDSSIRELGMVEDSPDDASQLFSAMQRCREEGIGGWRTAIKGSLVAEAHGSCLWSQAEAATMK